MPIKENTMIEFEAFRKIPRLSKENMVITEKIDGTNAQIVITEDGQIFAGSRSKYITPQDDNYGFAKWVEDNREELISKLGAGKHYGEWWGAGINRKYDKKEKIFSLFNTSVWTPETLPSCCSVVPTLCIHSFDTNKIEEVIKELTQHGSYAAPGFMKPEGICIYLPLIGRYYKKLIENDEIHKGELVAN